MIGDRQWLVLFILLITQPNVATPLPDDAVANFLKDANRLIG